jgi:redox-sensitive bicupin YhaK (pirin superfamily)
MITLRKSADRGRTKIDWLDSRHSFSFGDYYDPDQMGFRTLRVINEDRVRPGAGFPTHPHRDMEIITYILEGALEHKDSLGTSFENRPRSFSANLDYALDPWHRAGLRAEDDRRRESAR